jgi:fluoroacetyl-CoA thioesterase
VDVVVGSAADVVTVVTTHDTAAALGSGSLPVLGTPRLLAWCEQATCRALEPALPPGSTSVGAVVHLEHLVPSGVGERVTVRAEVERAAGRRIVLTVTATDAGGTLVARGTVERVVVDAQRFLGGHASSTSPPGRGESS